MAKPSEVETPAPLKRRVDWATLAPGIAFVLILAIAAVVYVAQNSKTVKEAKKEEAKIAALGLPQGYPLKDIPLYPGLKITEKKHGDATSSDGKPMDLWEIHGTSPDDKKPIFEFVKDKMMARNMSQTQYISIPTGYGVTYGDEKYSVEYEIEKQAKDKATRVVMRVYRLK